MQKTVIISIGSNVGNRYFYLWKAKELLTKKFKTSIASSPIYETDAWGKTNEPKYFNAILSFSTKLEPSGILANCQQIENQLGRKRIEKWGKRTIDLDIIFIDEIILKSPELCIPHPFFDQRAFVLKPLLDLYPEMTHPISRKPLCQYLQNLSQEKLTLFAPCF
jgi:2-amino-4-hydroxy-6-hydroxymethyldihydropteridine diphosphokinase